MSNLDRFLLAITAIGLVIGGGSLLRSILRGGQDQVEYISGKANDASESGVRGNDILVDVEGAVILPGVYELPINSRIKDILVKAGGYSANADRDYCEKNLNLAQVLKDGQKIYIPEKSNTPAVPGYAEAKSGTNLININSATASELDTLWGVGPARAETIIKNRPYGSLEEIVSKGGMTQSILDKNKDKISLF